jgi:hypothetical protein
VTQPHCEQKLGVFLWGYTYLKVLYVHMHQTARTVPRFHHNPNQIPNRNPYFWGVPAARLPTPEGAPARCSPTCSWGGGREKASRYCMSTCTRQHARCRDSTITLTRYLTEILTSEGRPLLAYLLLRGRPLLAYLLLRGRPPGARLLAPEGWKGKGVWRNQPMGRRGEKTLPHRPPI